MTDDEKQTVLAHVQFVSRHYHALRTSGEKLVELVRHSIGTDAPPAEAIANYLRRDAVQRELAAIWETALWISNDSNKSWRLVSLATTSDPELAAKRLAKRPPSPDACAWCWCTTSGAEKEALIVDVDINGVETGHRLHPQCQRPFNVLQRLVERSKLLEKNQ